MHKHPKLIFLVTVLVFLLAAVAISYPTFAVDNVVETTFFGNLQDDGEGCGVFTILNSVVDILSIGVGILAAIGITIVGIKYLTAKGDIAQTKKAKHRMFQIVLGLVAYVLLYAGVQWLLPGGKLNTSQQCTTISNQELATLKAQEKAQQQSNPSLTSSNEPNNDSKNSTSSNTDASTEQCMKKAAKAVRDKICKLKTPAERISKTARIFAANKSTYIKAMKEIGTYGYGGSSGQRAGSSCDTFVYTTMRASGVDLKFPINTSSKSSNSKIIYEYLSSSKKWKQVKTPKEGDIMVTPLTSSEMGHVSLVIKNGNGKLVTAEASNPDIFPKVQSSLRTPGSDRYKYVFHYVGD